MIESGSTTVSVQAVNLTLEDVWLHPMTCLGVFSAAECLSDEPSVKVKFHHISASTDQLIS